MMIRRPVVLLVMALLLTGLASVTRAPAAGEAVETIAGTLVTDPIPETYRIESSYLVVKPENWVIEVDGLGDCQEPLTGAMTPGEALVKENCRRVAAFFRMPEVFEEDGGEALYRKGPKRYAIGRITGVGGSRWVSLRRGASLRAGRKEASLVLDLARLPER